MPSEGGRGGGAAWRRFCLAAGVAAAIMLAAGGTAAAQRPAASPATGPATRPVTKAGGAIGELLRKWYAEGTAAGNVGDYYDNRDRGHSDLDMTPYPQLQRIEYAEAARQRRSDWARQVQLVPGVVFGNSSTSATVAQGGSNVRGYYVNPRGLAFLYEQYTHNNIYIYPEHVDHDPGHNGTPGHGDLYPTNTPYLITSQGSSGSDQPFMRAIPFTLAAFRPEVKKKLADSGLLMPTLQMILRATNRHLGAAVTTAASQAAAGSAYLTGKAHPTVFEGGWVDALKMVQMAHDIRLENIPPVVQLKVVREDQPPERLADTPAVAGWVFRGRARERKVTVSAQDSHDLNRRPLTYHWVLLRGDPERVKIRPLNPESSAAEIVVSYQERRPVADGSPLESNRVDVGVFAHNGAYYSAPGFLTWFFLDDEARTYDRDGRLLEFACGMGETTATVGNWLALLDLMKADAPPARILQKAFTGEQVSGIEQAGQEYRTAYAAVEAAQKRVNQADAARRRAAAAVKAAQTATASAPAGAGSQPASDRAQEDLSAAQKAMKDAETELAAARKELDVAGRSAEAVLNRKTDKLPPLRQVVENTLQALIDDPGFYPANAATIQALLQSAEAPAKAKLDKARRRLVGYGLLRVDRPDGFVLQPIMGAPPAAAASSPATAPADRLTRFERALIQQFNGELLGGLVLPGVVNCTFRRNFVDQRLAQEKSYRDVYRYDSLGRRLGLTRYDGEKATPFAPDSMPAEAR